MLFTTADITADQTDIVGDRAFVGKSISSLFQFADFVRLAAAASFSCYSHNSVHVTIHPCSLIIYI